jgi:hypothetical protein
MSSSEPISELCASLDASKAKGNEHFTAKRFPEAIACYDDALRRFVEASGSTSPSKSDAAAPPAASSVPGDARLRLALIGSQLYSNRSAAHFELGAFADALADATKAVEANPRWTKAYCRRASALKVLGRHREAHETLAAAHRLEPDDKGIKRLLGEAERAAAAADVRDPVTSVDHFALIFKAVPVGNPLRLATLATWWNLLPPPLRWLVFKRFLVIMAGPKAIDESIPRDEAPLPHISQFSPEVLTPLPMANYADIAVPAPWVAFASELATRTPADVVELFNRCWDLSSSDEQRAIIADVRTFFAGEGAAAAAAAASKGGLARSGKARRIKKAAGKAPAAAAAAAASGGAAEVASAAGSAGGSATTSAGDSAATAAAPGAEADASEDSDAAGSDAVSSDEEEDEGDAAALVPAARAGGVSGVTQAQAAMLAEAFRKMGIGVPVPLGSGATAGAGAGGAGAGGAPSYAPVRLPDEAPPAASTSAGSSGGARRR